MITVHSSLITVHSSLITDHSSLFTENQQLKMNQQHKENTLKKSMGKKVPPACAACTEYNRSEHSRSAGAEGAPLVSIIIPTYNRAHLIGETLDSVLAQTYQNWECIIVDDGSSDNTDEVVGAYVAKDSRFKYYHRPDEHLPGGNGARNYGFKMSKGEYVNWLDSDDLFSENKIEEQVEIALKENSDIVTCKWGLFNEHKTDIFENLKVYKNYSDPFLFFSDLYDEKGYFLSHAYLVKRSFLTGKSLWDEHLRINQDGVFFTKIIVFADSITFSNNTFCLYRKTFQSSVSSNGRNYISQYVNTIDTIEKTLKKYFNKTPATFKKYKYDSYKRLRIFIKNSDSFKYNLQILKFYKQQILKYRINKTTKLISRIFKKSSFLYE